LVWIQSTDNGSHNAVCSNSNFSTINNKLILKEIFVSFTYHLHMIPYCQNRQQKITICAIFFNHGMENKKSVIWLLHHQFDFFFCNIDQLITTYFIMKVSSVIFISLNPSANIFMMYGSIVSKPCWETLTVISSGPATQLYPSSENLRLSHL